MLWCNKRLVAEVMLEIIMLLAPTYLDILGSAGEFILRLNQSTMEFTCDNHGKAKLGFNSVKRMNATPYLV